MKAARMAAIAVSAAALAAASYADVALAPVFGDGMVLQRGTEIRVWGKAAPGETVVVRFGGEKASAAVSDDGTWLVELPPMRECREGRVLEAASYLPQPASWRNGWGVLGPGEKTGEASIKDVLVGEVWFCSGQSNADCPVWGRNPRYRDGMGALALQMNRRPLVRFAVTPHTWATEPKPDVSVKWRAAMPGLFEDFKHGASMPSAIGYYYAVCLFDALDIPIGFVDSSVGGTNIDSWTPRSGLETRPDLADVLGWKPVDAATWTPEMKKGPISSGIQQPTVLWNGMVAAFAPMAIRGFIWYQGCTNSGEPQRYCSKMHALYNGWAREFRNPSLKLYFVQLAPWGYSKIAAIQEAQAEFDAEEPNAGMAVINDLGNLKDIHPNDKRTVAMRLAAHALKRDYGFSEIRDNSPTLREWTVEDGAFVLTFADAEGWYVYTPDRSIQTGFEVAGEDGKFVPAQIEGIENDRSTVAGPVLKVFSKDVPDPKRLRYLHSSPWFGNLYNESGLPLGAFKIGE